MNSHEFISAPQPPAGGPFDRQDAPPARRDAPALIAFGILAVLVCIGLALEAPGLLLVLLVVATPAMIRTVVIASRERSTGSAPSGTAAAGIFLSSLGIVVIIGLASIAAFYATCFAVCLGSLTLTDLGRGNSSGWIMVASVGAGLAPGLFVAYWLARRLWPRRR